MMLVGQVSAQGVPHVTVTLNVHVARLVLKSVAKQVTVVVPGGN